MFIKMKEYIKLSRSERRKHLNLDTDCIEIGGDSRSFRGLLAHYLKTTIDKNVYVCHACNNDKCSNVDHLYWGTPKDNHIDQVEYGSWSSPRERTIKKYGLEEANKISKKASALGGKSGGGKNKLSKEQIQKYKESILECEFPKRGWKSRAARKMNVSHTQIKRVYDLYLKNII